MVLSDKNVLANLVRVEKLDRLPFDITMYDAAIVGMLYSIVDLSDDIHQDFRFFQLKQRRVIWGSWTNWQRFYQPSLYKKWESDVNIFSVTTT